MVKGGFWMRVTCDRCGFEQDFTRPTKGGAVVAAKVAGWDMGRKQDGTGSELCASCHTPIISLANVRADRLTRKTRNV